MDRYDAYFNEEFTCRDIALKAVSYFDGLRSS